MGKCSRGYISFFFTTGGFLFFLRCTSGHRLWFLTTAVFFFFLVFSSLYNTSFWTGLYLTISISFILYLYHTLWLQHPHSGELTLSARV